MTVILKGYSYRLRTKEAMMCQIKKESEERKIYITGMMLRLGMPAHLNGYHYLREGICMSLEDMELVGSVTKLLYPEIAKRYHTSSEKVERAIRSAIEVSWKRGDEKLFEEIFGYSRVHGKIRPTNSEFILGVSDRICMDLSVKI